MNSLYDKKNKYYVKKNIAQNNSIYPRIISPYIQQKFGKKYKESNTMANFNKNYISKIPKKTLSTGVKDYKTRYKSNSGTRKFHINNGNNLTKNELSHLNNYEMQNLNNISSYDSLQKIWNDFGILHIYKELFNMILIKLNDEEKEDLCKQEIKEIKDLINNIKSLNKEIQSRKKSLKNLNLLDNKLGEMVSDEGNNVDEEIIKNISDEITNLRIYTVNVVYKMKKIKNKIFEGYTFGKFDLDKISENFGLDINYLIKMKEEMLFLKEGYIKSFFNINNDYSPFLLKASEKINNSNGEPYINIVPISKELKENIKQCNCYIYQDLIYYQNHKIKNNYHKAISLSKSENKIFISKYKGNIFNKKIERNNNNYVNYNINDERVNYREFNMNEKDKNIQDESILFEEKGINMKDILGNTDDDKHNNQIINKNIKKPKAKNNIKIYSKNTEKFSESQISKKSDIISNNTNRKFNRSSSCAYSYKNFRVVIFNNYINYFNENYYNDYYKKIPEQEISMFNLQNNILPPLLNGIAPFLLLVKDENDIIYGICAFNYIYHKSKLKIKINHISAIADYNYNDYIDNLKVIYRNIINYIIKQFYFDELFVEFSKNKKNEEIYDLFVNKFSFVEKTISIKKNQNESNGGDEISNNENNKLNFLLYRNKVQINESIKESITSFFGNNLFHFFDSILVTNKNKTINLNNKSSGEKNDLNYLDSDLFINLIAINHLFQTKNNSIFSNIYKKISSLEHLIKIFLNNNINNEEIPLSIAENRFDIVSFVINKIINDILKNSSKLINNYNIYNSSSFLDENTGIFYNFMKPEKIYILFDNKNEMNFYIISNNIYAVFFLQINNQEIKKYILKQNLYIQINEIYNELLSNKMIDLLENKLIWIPCFSTYKHLKCLINNSSFYVHEYIRISNKVINSGKKNKSYGLLFNKELNSFLIEPQVNKDIILDNDFIIGIINNPSYFNKLFNNKNDSSSLIKEKEKIIPSNYSIKSEDEKEKNNEFNKSETFKNVQNKQSKDDINSSDFPKILFLNYISKKDFIINQ